MSGITKGTRDVSDVPGRELKSMVVSSAQSTELFRNLEEIAWKVNSSLDPTTLLQEIARTVTSYSLWNGCWIGVVDFVSDRFVSYADSGFGVEYSDEEMRNWPASGSPSIAALERGEPLCIADALNQDEFPRLRDNALRRRYGAILVIPLHLGEEQGAMWFCSSTPRTFNDQEIAYASAIAAQAAIAFRNARLLQRQRQLLAEEQQRTTTLELLNVLATHQNALLERVNSIHTRLTEIVLAERGVNSLARTMAELVGNPAIILNQFKHVVAVGGINRDEAGGWLSEPGLEELCDRLLGERRALVWTAASGRRLLLTPIVSGRSTLGYLCVLESNRRFEDLDTMTAEQSALVVALELMKERIRLDAELRLKTDFVDALLSSTTSEVDLEQRAALLGLDLSGSSQVLLIDADPPVEDDGHGEPLVDLPATLIDVVSSRLDLQKRGAIAVVLGGARLVVVSPSGSPSASNIEEGAGLARSIQACVNAAPRLLHGMTISVGVGRPYAGPAGIRQSYEEASEALRVVRALGQRNIVMPVTDVGAYEVLLGGTSYERLAGFADRVLGALQEYDEQRGGELVRTLEAYLECCGSTHRVAELLCLHVTTVRYRLTRIEDITGLPLDDAENRLNFQLAFHIRRLAPRPGGDRSSRTRSV